MTKTPRSAADSPDSPVHPGVQPGAHPGSQPAPQPGYSAGPVLRVADLPAGQTRALRIEPEADTLAAIAADLDLIALRKLRFEGALSPLGKRDWQLTGHLGATVVQPCVVTLAPVTTRIEDDVSRRWIAGPSPRAAAAAAAAAARAAEASGHTSGQISGQTPDAPLSNEIEIEIPEDVDQDPLGAEIDIGAVVLEALALALPAWPRAADADLGEAVFTQPGEAPMTDEAARPFAGLAALRDKLADAGPDTDTDTEDDQG